MAPILKLLLERPAVTRSDGTPETGISRIMRKERRRVTLVNCVPCQAYAPEFLDNLSPPKENGRRLL
jgi:hypothetical protein